MAEQIIFNVAGELITKVGSYGFQEIQRIYGVKDYLKEFEESLSIVKGVLLDADEEKREKNHAMEAWLTRVKDLVYEADDLLDELAFKDLRRIVFQGNVTRQVFDFFSSSNQIRFGSKVGHKIKDLAERLNRIKNDISIFNLVRKEMIVVGQATVSKMISARETDSRVRKFGIIGREEDKKNIIESLCASGQENVCSVAIVGLGGLGKTTLAQLVYNDKQVDDHFEMKMWVCVSEEFEVKLLIKKILKCVTSMKIEDLEKLELEQLQNDMREVLGGKRYLVVLDDVWNEDWEKWDSLEKYLLDGVPGSKILVTTRSKRVASIMGVGSPYELKGLDENQAWDLFETIALRDGSSVVNPNKVRIGKEIVKKCKGAPLVIRTIGGLMQFKTRENEWLSVLENDLWRSCCDSRGDFIPVLKLSYDHLPIHLRKCFVYCAMFPKDYEFDREMLINLWMAQGYIVGSSRNESLEEIGEQYFNELLFRSFFQLYEYDTDFEKESYKMHDLMHDLAQSLAKDSCLVVEVKNMENVLERVQHVFCSGDTRSINKLAKESNSMRTLLLANAFGGENDRIVSNCQKLRALICPRGFPNSIGKLKHLRYLEISVERMQTLPNSLSNLHHLQSLILSRCYFLRELPRDVQNLISLRTLLIYECEMLEGMPMGLGKLTGLHKLSEFRVSSSRGTLSELEHLNQLRGSPKIEGVGRVRNVETECKKLNLLKKEDLQVLTLNWHACRDVGKNEFLLENMEPHPNLQKLQVKCYPGVKFSHWLPRITSLVKLELEHCPNLKQIPKLEQLSSLKTLSLLALNALKYVANEEEVESSCFDSDDNSSALPSTTSFSFFPSLQVMRIRHCRKLKGWWRERRRRSRIELCQFHCLSELYIEDCKNLASLPEGFRQLTSLQELIILECPKLSERCEKEKGVDWPNISHIPKIVIE